MKDGLSGAGVVLPEAEAELVRNRTREWSQELATRTRVGQWLTSQVVIESVRIDHCVAREREIRIQMAQRAASFWEEDREQAAERLAVTLSRAPSLVARQLEGTAQGCEWLIQRWEGLLVSLEGPGNDDETSALQEGAEAEPEPGSAAVACEARSWDDAQRDLALDLLGAPPSFARSGDGSARPRSRPKPPAARSNA